MKIYLITDTHFNHQKLVEYSGRPENFDELIWKGLEELPKDCILIHLGDICIGKESEVHERWKNLPFKKILVKGNHDGKSNSWYLDHGWDFVCESLTDTYFGKKVTFSHIPIRWQFLEIEHINIHGHFHNNEHRMDENIKGYYNKNFHKLLAIEYTDYKPIKLQTFLNGSIN